ncbi:hypothetical protein RISK_002062 [Rhodopirellula islandica]|uniref:Uncharacterized protein n=1 Tax=Rhodopirellula islandica TaxID=595434 RepID=A0A0J1BI31_RHOIS|nr:hypothetical protein RISK_002062 [Rhodopirellula islandica]
MDLPRSSSVDQSLPNTHASGLAGALAGQWRTDLPPRSGKPEGLCDR